MAIKDENKGSYFVLGISDAPVAAVEFKQYNKIVEEQVDIILSQMKSNNIVYKFVGEDKILYCFGTRIRARNGKLTRISSKYLKDKGIANNIQSFALTKGEFYEKVQQLKSSKAFQLHDQPSVFEGYNGNDIKVFNKSENWYSWQKELFDLVFFQTGEIREPDPRQILHLYDPDGNSGKSSFFKYLFYKNPDDIGRIGYGSTSQLRSSIGVIGIKKIYIVDLSRAKGVYDREEDLLAVIDEIKTGLITSTMFGKGKTILMNPPHIIISSSYLFDQNLLSKDRWKILKITKEKHLKNITNRVKVRETVEKLERD